MATINYRELADKELEEGKTKAITQELVKLQYERGLLESRIKQIDTRVALLESGEVNVFVQEGCDPFDSRPRFQITAR